MNEMTAVQIVAAGQPLESASVPIEPPGPSDVVLRVAAAGICRSDVHYRRGPRTMSSFPMAPGHEIAGEVVEVGRDVTTRRIGDRVAIHYQTSCGACPYCASGNEQFCATGQMFGRSRPGGYAEYVTSPARNTFPVPDAVSFEHAAVMMCSSATSLHALLKGRLRARESVAVFGVGGLGMSAIQIARSMGASSVFAADINPAKLDLARAYGAIPIDASEGDPAAEIRSATGGSGVDVALELVGLTETMRQAVDSVRPFGRAVVVGVGEYTMQMQPFEELAMREAELIGCMDHRASEIPTLFELALSGHLVLDDVVGSCVRLDAEQINAAMDRLEAWGDVVRTVIIP